MPFLRICLLFHLFYCFIFALTAEEPPPDPYASSLTKTQSLLPTMIQSVSAISGQWIESEIDFIIPGPEPLVLTRSYAPGYSSGRLGKHWDFNRPQRLLIEDWLSDIREYYSKDEMNGKKIDKKTAKRITKKNEELPVKARLHHPNGITTIHKGKVYRGKKRFIRLPLSNMQGLTNCGLSEMSARTNLHNTILQIDKEKLQCLDPDCYLRRAAYSRLFSL